MGSTFKCTNCNFTVRVFTEEELEEYHQEHSKNCNGKLENIWKNYDKIPKKKKEEMMNKVMFRHGVIETFPSMIVIMKQKEV